MLKVFTGNLQGNCKLIDKVEKKQKVVLWESHPIMFCLKLRLWYTGKMLC